MSIELTLLSRSYCHLCHDLAEALQPLLTEYSAQLMVLDIDEHPHWLALYDELVPVLLHQDQELCHYFLDEARVRAYLEANA